MSDRRVLKALLRKDLASFIQKTFHSVRPGETYFPNWHIDAIAWHLQGCFEGRIKRLVITMPPRHLKSLAASVAFPAWVLGQDPTQKIIAVSYAQELANKHALDTRAVMESLWYRDLFPGTRLHRDKNAVTEFMTTLHGFRLATSIGGTLTGRGGNLIIIDDAHKPDEITSETRREGVLSWYRNTLISRLDNKQDDVIIVIQQRLHEGDLAGTLLEAGGWVHLDLPAIAEEEQRIIVGHGRVHLRRPGDCIDPARESPVALEELKEVIGSYAFAAQYQQRPAPLGGGRIKWDWFRPYEVLPVAADHYDQIVQSWDTAIKAEAMNDYSVCTTWLIRNNQLYLLDVFRARLEFPDLKKKVKALAETWRATHILIEDKGAGSSLIQDLNRETTLCIIPFEPKDDKETRAMTVSPMIESGQVHVPQEALWLTEFHREIVSFPKARHDDQVDSLTQFLTWRKAQGTYNEEAFMKHLEAVIALNEYSASLSPLRESWNFD